MHDPRLSSPSVQGVQTRLASRFTQHVTVALAVCLLALVLG